MKWSDFSTKQKMYLIGGLFVISGIGVLTEDKKKQNKATVIPAETREKTYTPGDVMPSADYILAGVTKDDLSAVFDAQRIKDKLGIKELILAGRAVPIEKGQKLMFLEAGFASSTYKVRVQEGSQAGRSCYIPREFFTGKFSK